MGFPSSGDWCIALCNLIDVVYSTNSSSKLGCNLVNFLLGSQNMIPCVWSIPIISHWSIEKRLTSQIDPEWDFSYNASLYNDVIVYFSWYQKKESGIFDNDICASNTEALICQLIKHFTLTILTRLTPDCEGGSCSVFSICTTASAPSGTGPPKTITQFLSRSGVSLKQLKGSVADESSQGKMLNSCQDCWIWYKRGLMWDAY